METIEQRLSKIEQRNQKVEIDKAWETSVTRKISIAIFTYLAVSIYFMVIQIDRPFINAVVPTCGFLLSTLSLPFIRRIWEKFNR